jgi:hypothetical protein
MLKASLFSLLTAFAVGPADGFRRIPCLPAEETVTLLVSPSFSGEKAAVIIEAAETWNSVLGRPALRLLTATAPLAPGLDGLSAIYPSEATGGSTAHKMSYGPGGWVRMDTDVRISEVLEGEPLYNVALHELGHVLGLDHSMPGTIMGYKLRTTQDGLPLPDTRQYLTWDDAIGAW